MTYFSQLYLWSGKPFCIFVQFVTLGPTVQGRSFALSNSETVQQLFRFRFLFYVLKTERTVRTNNENGLLCRCRCFLDKHQRSCCRREIQCCRCHRWRCRRKKWRCCCCCCFNGGVRCFLLNENHSCCKSWLDENVGEGTRRHIDDVTVNDVIVSIVDVLIVSPVDKLSQSNFMGNAPKSYTVL